MKKLPQRDQKFIICLIHFLKIFLYIFFLLLLSFSLFSDWYKPISLFRWCTVAASVGKLQQISIIGFCVWVPPRTIRTTPSTSLKMRGGEASFLGIFMDEAHECAVFIHFNSDGLSSLQEYALSPRDLQYHAYGQNGSCRQTGESV